MGCQYGGKRGARRALLVVCLISGGIGPGAYGESILFIGPGAPVGQGSTFSALILLQNNTTNLVGYSLDVDIVGLPGATGAVTGNVVLSNFLLARNLIELDPDDELHPIFSGISAAGDGGVFFNAQSLSGNPVDLALPGFSDGLGEVFFDVSNDALGMFEISLGPSTVLFDGTNKVPFSSNVFTVEVTPEPCGLAMLVGMWLLAHRRRGGRRVRASQACSPPRMALGDPELGGI